MTTPNAASLISAVIDESNRRADASKRQRQSDAEAARRARLAEAEAVVDMYEFPTIQMIARALHIAAPRVNPTDASSDIDLDKFSDEYYSAFYRLVQLFVTNPDKVVAMMKSPQPRPAPAPAPAVPAAATPAALPASASTPAVAASSGSGNGFYNQADDPDAQWRGPAITGNINAPATVQAARAADQSTQTLTVVSSAASPPRHPSGPRRGGKPRRDPMSVK